MDEKCLDLILKISNDAQKKETDKIKAPDLNLYQHAKPTSSDQGGRHTDRQTDKQMDDSHARLHTDVMKRFHPMIDY